MSRYHQISDKVFSFFNIENWFCDIQGVKDFIEERMKQSTHEVDALLENSVNEKAKNKERFQVVRLNFTVLTSL